MVELWNYASLNDLYSWCNQHTCNGQYAFYLDEEYSLHSRFCTIIPENQEVAEQLCKLYWAYWKGMNLIESE